jgi:thioredoxin reductase (NADPH)
MAKPIIMTVDDEPEVLNAIERDLRRHYGADYRIIKANSGSDALAAVQQLKQRGDLLALFLVDQRMPGMTGTEFLKEAAQHFSDSRKVLLTAYADTEVAIQGINSIGLDHYLLKPWSPPDRKLYPLLDDLLSDWVATVELPFEGLRVIGSQESADSHRVKEFLARNQVPYQWLNVDRSAEGRLLLEGLPEVDQELPIVIFPGGDYLANPDNLQLAERGGLSVSPEQPFHDLIICGAGPAGLAAAVNAASEGILVALVEREAPGGQAGGSARIENYLGFPKGLSGADLTRRAVTQAKRFEAELLTAREVVSVRSEFPYHFVRLDDGSEMSCHALLIATGVQTRLLDVPGAAELTGAGLYYGAAVSEARNYRDRQVLIVGGGNSAGQGAEFLARFASKVTILVRSTSLKVSMSQYLIDRIEKNETIDVMPRVSVAQVLGEDRVEGVRLDLKDSDEEQTLEAAAIFVYTGAQPRTEFLEGIVVRDPAGFLLGGPDLVENGERPKGWSLHRDPMMFECSVPGIFTAGDVRHGSVKRVAAAIGEGSAAVRSIHRYLNSV